MHTFRVTAWSQYNYNDMAVRKISNTWRVDIRHNRRRYRITSPENSKKGAEAYEAVLRHKMARGEPLGLEPQIAAKPEIKFGEFAKEWLETYAKVNNKPSTVKAKESSLRLYLVPYFGALTLNKIDTLSIEKFKVSLKECKLSPKSINCHLSVLLTCLKTACDWGQMVQVPKVVLLKLSPPETNYLTPQEVAKLLSVKNSVVKEMVLCAWWTGMRIGEICALRWEDVDLGSGIITVKRSVVNGIIGSPKSNKTRIIPIGSDLHFALAVRQKREGYVFTQEDGRLFTSGTQWKVLDTLRREAGVRKIGWHALRHTFATNLSNSNAPMRAVQKLLGHATLQMTERYAHVDRETLNTTIGLLHQPVLVPLGNYGHQAGTDQEENGS